MKINVKWKLPKVTVYLLIRKAVSSGSIIYNNACL